MKKAFTLAETLITLAIIGVVAVVVMPTLVVKYKEKVWESQAWSVVYKLTQATDQMKSHGLIGPYLDTSSFISELKNNLKITKVCDNSNLEACWPIDKIMRIDGTELNVSDLKTGKNFGTEGFTKNNIGFVTTDGTPVIMSYKDDCKALDSTKAYGWTLVGGKPYTNATTSCIAMIYDINGKSGPNKSGEDVRLFNVSSLNKGLECKEAYGVCMLLSNVSYSPLNQAECEAQKDKLGISRCIGSYDYWAGAKKACKDMSGRLMKRSEAVNVMNAMGYNCGIFSSESSYCYNIREDLLGLKTTSSDRDYYSYWLDDEALGSITSEDMIYILGFGLLYVGGRGRTAISITESWRYSAGGGIVQNSYFTRCVAD